MARGGRDSGVPDGDMVAEQDAQPRIAFGRSRFRHVLHGSADREALAKGARVHLGAVFDQLDSRDGSDRYRHQRRDPPGQAPNVQIHGFGAGGATAASRWPLLSSARATNPESFISSMNSRRQRAPSARPLGVPMACSISMKRPSITRMCGLLLASPASGSV